jgi:glycosyltransferase involved in cell wall biosynthesis
VGTYPVPAETNILVVNTFANDEPLDEVLSAAGKLNQAHFYITGKVSRAGNRLPENLPGNITFTDYLPDEDYYGLMNRCQAVMCLTTRDHTMQRGACEALSMGKPIITSNWPLLLDYFHKGTVHVDNTVAGIQQGVEAMLANIDHYRREIVKLQAAQQQEWRRKIKLLENLIKTSRTGQDEDQRNEA